LPQTALDGELWLGRGRFDELSGIVRWVPPFDADWHRVQYMIFELPQATELFSKRVQFIKEARYFKLTNLIIDNRLPLKVVASPG
jgi:DNA ligase-1